MSLSAVYLHHRVQLLARNVSTLVKMMKLRLPVDAEDHADLIRVWQARVDGMFAARLHGIGRNLKSETSKSASARAHNGFSLLAQRALCSRRHAAPVEVDRVTVFRPARREIHYQSAWQSGDGGSAEDRVVVHRP